MEAHAQIHCPPLLILSCDEQAALTPGSCLCLSGGTGTPAAPRRPRPLSQHSMGSAVPEPLPRDEGLQLWNMVVFRKTSMLHFTAARFKEL